MGRGFVPNGKIYYLSLSINPFGQTGASSSASEVCKRESGRPREGGSQPDEEKEMWKDKRGGGSRSSGVKWKKMGWEEEKAKVNERMILYLPRFESYTESGGRRTGG